MVPGLVGRGAVTPGAAEPTLFADPGGPPEAAEVDSDGPARAASLGTGKGRAASQILGVTRIYTEPEAASSPRGRQILGRWPDAEVVEVASHWQIRELHGDETNVNRWVRIKREALVLGVKKTLSARPNGRSADFIAPSTANGCAMACAYCYVPRRKGYSNPITVFTNIDQITGYLTRHAHRQGLKTVGNQCDPTDWVYDIGENSDCSVDAVVSDNVADLIGTFAALPNAKASFATKYVNPGLLDLNPRGRTRIRFSLMPATTAKLLDIRTSPISERLAALDDFVAAGYQVHLNFSPIVVFDGWLDAWAELLDQLDAATSTATKAQLACEIIFLTHNEQLHQVNLGWHPQAEELLWQPRLQEPKRSENGAVNTRYRWQDKQRYLERFQAMLLDRAPWCTIRYAF